MSDINAPAPDCCPIRAEAARRLSDIFDADFFRALCEPVRLQLIVNLVRMGRSDVTGLAAVMPQDRSVISRHLKMLERAGIASSEQQGRHVFYQVDGHATVSHFEAILTELRGMVALEEAEANS
ncbi:winged helix-turn-helix transcriptional regulator [Paracoccus sp. M683]|uniref:ArsR/SmtB family transcription factor n=1 Tax=Paracoccus sp. M683 TaxID=2594268 RepID=UPI00117DF13C|nr:metalloregulator ArsR/SmtB family transcription factor [Paracoccus sp. M683]TRW97697.1 winged helix-turn-helix transcriptional regulator [Paracoccus sp. M683]